MRHRLRLGLGLLAAVAWMLQPGLAAAHDTWFAPLPGGQLALGTGNRFPAQETGVARQALVQQGCQGPGNRPGMLRPQRDLPQALSLALPRGAAPHSCWAQTAPLDIRLAPDKVALYLDEVRAPAAVRQRWADLAARGVAWQERYAKHARVALGPGAASQAPSPMAMDIVLQGPLPQAGGELAFAVLYDQQPLPHFAVELVHAGTGAGFWLRTNAQGQAQVRVPLPGAWLLRGTELRPHPQQAEAWDSRFVTLALHIVPAPPVAPACVQCPHAQ